MSELRELPAFRAPEGERLSSHAKLVPCIRSEVDRWRLCGYQGATETSKYLMRHWFESDHEVAGIPWLYYW